MHEGDQGVKTNLHFKFYFFVLNIIENFLCLVFSRKFAFIATLIYESVKNIKKTMKYKQAMYKVFH